MQFEIVDIAELSTVLLTVSAVVVVLVDMLKQVVKPLATSKEGKYISSILIAVTITLTAGISIFDAASEAAFYTGSVLAGFIAGLGSNFIHEFMKVLQTVKTIKGTKSKSRR